MKTASTEYFKPLYPNNNFLRQSGETQEYLADAQKAQEWRNNLAMVPEKKTKKIKPKSPPKGAGQITLF